MLSYVTWQYLIKVSNAGCKWGVYSHKLVLGKAGYELIPAWNIQIPKIVSGVGFITNLAIVAVVGLSAWIINEYAFAVLCGGAAGTILGGCGFQYWYLAKMKDIFALESMFIRLHNHLHKAHGIPLSSKQTDGYEVIAKVAYIGMVAVQVALFPFTLLVLVAIDNQLSRNTFLIFGKTFEFCGIPQHPVVVAAVATLAIGVSYWSLVISLFAAYRGLLCALPYTNATRLWVQQLSVSMRGAEGTARNYELEYVKHQVVNKFANDVFASAIECGLYLLQLVLIACTYASVKFTKRSIIIVPGLLFLVGTMSFILKELIVLAVLCHVNSAECCRIGKFSLGDTTCNRMFWKSRKPVDIQLGKHFVLDANDFILTIFGKVVLENVIDLLVAF